MKNIVIETPSFKDIPLLRKWGTETRELWAYEGSGWHEEETLKDYIENPKDDFFRVAKIDEQIVGMILVNIIRNWAYVDFLFVHRDYRHKGVGKALINAASEHIRSKGLDMINLVTHPNSKSVQFYDKLGFERGDTLIWERKKIINTGEK